MAEKPDHAGQGRLPSAITKQSHPRWESRLRHWYGHDMPNDYLSWDTETSGFTKNFDIPLEFGWCVVRDRQPVNRGSKFLNWTLYPQLVEKDWLVEQLERIEDSFRERNRVWPITWDKLRLEGQDPLKVIRFAHKLFRTNREAGAAFVGHNSITYDNELWCNVFREFIGEEWHWYRQEIYDTGCLEKALLTQALPLPKQLAPQVNEDLYDFLRRCARANRPGIKWNLDACVARYNLCESHGLCADDLHGAAADAFACHLLTELHRETADV